jgi:hypothetical protein
MIAAVFFDASPSSARARLADRSLAFFAVLTLGLAGEKRRRGGFALLHQSRGYGRERPGRESTGRAPIGRIIARDAERAPEGDVSA